MRTEGRSEQDDTETMIPAKLKALELELAEMQRAEQAVRASGVPAVDVNRQLREIDEERRRVVEERDRLAAILSSRAERDAVVEESLQDDLVITPQYPPEDVPERIANPFKHFIKEGIAQLAAEAIVGDAKRVPSGARPAFGNIRLTATGAGTAAAAGGAPSLRDAIGMFFLSLHIFSPSCSLL